ncbi:MAG: site-specific DNA-methyltransferase [Betaproteobacteria bacterium]|nr:site-specific DNA-methyltransferase [Betaproteobacteria bacterium]
MNLQQALTDEFEGLIGFSVDLPIEYRRVFKALCCHLAKRKLRTRSERRNILISHINSKFDINREGIAAVLARAASRGLVFNFHEKNLIQRAFDLRDKAAFADAVRKARNDHGLHSLLCQLFTPATEEETLAHFRAEVTNPSRLRVEKGVRPIGNEILLSALSAFVFSAADEEVMHEFFDSAYSHERYERSFWLQLRKLQPQFYSRTRTLDIAKVDQNFADSCGSLETLRLILFGQTALSYKMLENHGYLAYWIEPLVIDGRNVTWEICSDIMLFAEKHDEVMLTNTYFKTSQIKAETVSYVNGIDESNARFDLANEGFTYKDIFVCIPSTGSLVGSESLLLLFQKNKRDETLIPCPACRTHNVQGNSYPSLGVRSWECRNILCPDRSKYNRGKRYSFKSLLMQEAIDEIESQISPESIRRWSRDIQIGRTADDAVEMLIRHYSLHGDGVYLFGINDPNDSLGRRIVRHEDIMTTEENLASCFFDSHWFKRYAFSSDVGGRENASSINQCCIGSLTMVHGDSCTVLEGFPDNYFDGAVTSPPYFNAREYSQWSNIYCYLHDMLSIAKSCFRVLKPGATYLYNIFDYFDNERSIVFSAMGEKRLVLSAYTADLFRRVGFQLAGAITWDKGEIEGKRGFNAGNFSPYYQAPFNCWEHILVFVKPPTDMAQRVLSNMPAVLRAQPVNKMVKGKNTHGHTAPFPADIPNLLRPFLPKGGRVLDPFGGSGTTARALDGFVSETICIEKKKEYFDLALNLFMSYRSALNQGTHQAILSREEIVGA